MTKRPERDLWGTAAGLSACALACLVSVAPPALAASLPGCDQLTVGPATLLSSTLSATVVVPSELGKVKLPDSAFQVLAGSAELPVQASRLTGTDVGVVVVLAASPTTPQDAFERARAAALELVVNLPPNAMAGLVTASGSPSVVVPLTADHEQLAVALRSLRQTGGDTTQQAVAMAARLLRPSLLRHVVVLSDATTAGRAAPAGTTIHDIYYGEGGSPATSGCPSGGAAVPLVTAMDAVTAQLTGTYRIHVTPAPGPTARLQLQFQGVTRVADLRSSAAPSGPGPSPDAASAPAPGSEASPLRAANRGGPSHLVVVALALAVVALLGAVALRRRASFAGRATSLVALVGRMPGKADGREERGRQSGLPRSPDIAARQVESADGTPGGSGAAQSAGPGVVTDKATVRRAASDRSTSGRGGAVRGLRLAGSAKGDHEHAGESESSSAARGTSPGVRPLGKGFGFAAAPSSGPDKGEPDPDERPVMAARADPGTHHPDPARNAEPGRHAELLRHPGPFNHVEPFRDLESLVTGERHQTPRGPETYDAFDPPEDQQTQRDLEGQPDLTMQDDLGMQDELEAQDDLAGHDDDSDDLDRSVRVEPGLGHDPIVASTAFDLEDPLDMLFEPILDPADHINDSLAWADAQTDSRQGTSTDKRGGRRRTQT